MLCLGAEKEEVRLAIGRCLRVWPPPHLHCYYSVQDHWRELGLPAGAAAEWTDNQIFKHLLGQQSKVAALMSGLHR